MHHNFAVIWQLRHLKSGIYTVADLGAASRITQSGVVDGGVFSNLARRLLLWSSPLVLLAAVTPAQANCTTSGLTTTCDGSSPDPYTSRIGNGPTEADNRTVTVGSGATVSAGNNNAIALRDNSRITIESGGTVQNNATSAGGLYGGGGGWNTIDVRNNNTIVIEQGGRLLANGPDGSAEVINFFGSGNTLINNGLIRSSSNTAAIWFANTSGQNTVVNNATGVIQGGNGVAFGQGGSAPIDFTNYGRIVGNLSFGGGNDTLRMFTGSEVTGSISGGGGSNDRIFLDGDGTASIPGALNGFEFLTKSGSGAWTISGTITGPLVTVVEAGKLILTGNNTAYNGSMRVDSGATLEARAQSLPPTITNNGLVHFAQPDNGTYAGPISGSGQVEKTGAGVLTLAPTAPSGNTYTGGTTISGGTLAIARDLAIGATTGALTFNGGTLRYDAAFDLAASRAVSIGSAGGTIATNGFTTTLSQGITGDGALTVDGSGNLILTGANSYAGGTTVNSGARLQLGSGGATGAITGDVANNGTLTFNRSNEETFAGIISGTGAVRQEGAGTTILTAENSFSGGTTITAGTLQVGNGGTSGSIAGDVTNNGALVFNRSNAMTFAGSISGTGTLTKTGSGTLELTGNSSSFSGPTTLAGGGLKVNGSLADSTVTAMSGTTLSGVGTVGGILARSGSTIAPGNSPGTLTVSRDYVQSAGSTYATEIVPGSTTSDLIVVNGTATIDRGAQLAVSTWGSGDLSANSRYTILTATGGVTGTYNLIGGPISAFYTVKDDYDANNVYLRVTQTRSFADAALTPNEKATADGLESLPIGNGLRGTIGTLPSDAQARAAFNQLSGELHASLKSALIDDSRFPRDASIDRLRSAFDGKRSNLDVYCHDGMARDAETSPTASHACYGSAIWMQAYGAWGHISGDSNTARLPHRTGGFLIGFDAPIFDTWRLGMLGGYSRSTTNGSDRNSSATSDNYTVGLYGGTQWGNLGLRLGTAYTSSDIDSKRDPAFSAFSDRLSGDYTAGTAQVFGDLGYRIEAGPVSLEPFAGLAYVNVNISGFTEKGGLAALTSKGGNTGVTFSTLGLRAATTFAIAGVDLTTSGTVGWRHAFGDVSPTSTFEFNGSDPFSIGGAPIAKDTALLEAGLSTDLSRNVSIGLFYQGQFGGGTQSQGARGNLTIKF